MRGIFVFIGIAISFFFSSSVISQSFYGQVKLQRLIGSENEPFYPTLVRATNQLKVDVLGEQLVFDSPRNYCGLTQSGVDLELFDEWRKSIKENRLLLALVRCDELEAFRRGKREVFDHWILIQLIGIKGKFQKLDVSRDTFLNGVSQGSKKMNPVDLENRINSRLKEQNTRMQGVNYKPIGRDANAFYFALNMIVTNQNISRDVNCLAALALSNGLPLGIYVYEADGSMESRRALAKVLQETLIGVLQRN